VKNSESGAWSGGRRFAVITGAWCYFAALLTLNNYVYSKVAGHPVSWWDAAYFPLITYASWTVFTPIILYFCERVRRQHWKAWGWVAVHTSFAIFVLLLIAIISIPFTQAEGDLANVSKASWHFVSILFWQSVAWNLWMYWVIVGIFYGLDYYFGERDARIRAAQLEGQLAKAELEVLKGQLQPHFLFNTLNLISSLMHTDPASADDMIGDLGSLLRLSLKSQAAHEVSLAEEMSALELYLNIQRQRFQDTLKVEIEMDPSTVGAKVPHLILQPLVENAFRHGIWKRVGEGRLRIESKNGDGMLRLRISDNGPGITGEVAKVGIGLANTRSRLERLYGTRATLQLENTAAGFSVELRLPLVMTNSANAANAADED
jgi:two-component system LytT family sensor kinase